MDSAKVVAVIVEMAAMAVMAAMAAMAAMEATVVTAEGHQLVAQEIADTSLILESLVARRLLEELGHGKLKSRSITVSHFAAELW